MSVLQIEEELLQLIERLIPVKNFLMQNTYVKDTTKKLSRIMDDAQENPMVMLIGKERVGKTTTINSFLGFDILSSSTKNPTKINAFLKFGDSEHIKAVFLDGMEVIFDLNKLSILSTADTNSAQIIREHMDYIEIYLQHDALKELTLVDTVALESDHKGGAYFSLATQERVDELLWLLRAGSPLTDAELQLLKKYAAQNIQPHIIVNATDDYKGNIQTFIEAEKERYGQFVTSFTTISSRLAIEAAKSNDSQLLNDSNFMQFSQLLESFKKQPDKKIENTMQRLFAWLQLFLKELQHIPNKEPYISAIQTVEQFNEEHFVGSTKEQRDYAIINAYREEYEEVSSVFKNVETLYQLLQKLAATFYLRDTEVELFEELAFSYQQNVRDYRKKHTEYSQMYNRAEATYRKGFGKYLQQWTASQTNEQMTWQVDTLKRLYRELKDLFNIIKHQQKQLLQHFYKTQNHLTDLARKRLNLILKQVAELNHQRKVEMVNLKSYNDKIQEFKCIDLAQRFLIDAVKPFVLTEMTGLSSELRAQFASLFAQIEAENLVITKVENEHVFEMQPKQKIEVDFETEYQFTPLSLTEADIVSDIPELPASI